MQTCYLHENRTIILTTSRKSNKKLCEDVNLCRICDEEYGEIPMFDNAVYPNLNEEIYSFSGVKVRTKTSIILYS